MSPETHPYARRWQALIVLAVSLLVDQRRQHDPQRRAADDPGGARRQLERAAVDRGRLHARLRGAAARRRHARRPLRAPPGARRRAGDVRARLASSPPSPSSSTELIASRALMGVGAAGIMPTTLSILTNIFPASERPKAIAIWSAVAGLGVADRADLGRLADRAPRLALDLPLQPAGRRRLPGRRRAARPRVARPRAAAARRASARALSIAGLSALVWGLIEAPERGWTDTAILGAFAGGVAILRRLRRLGAPRATQPDARPQRVPQPALQRAPARRSRSSTSR